MNPSLPLRNALTRWSALIALAAIVAPNPLHARERSVEIESEDPYVLSIIDDPDPTGRLRRRILYTGEQGIIIPFGQVEFASVPSVLFTVRMATPIAAWSRDSGSGFDIVASRLVRGVWAPPTSVSSWPADELDPQLTEDPADGSVHLVYWVDGAEPFVVHRSAPADLSAWSEPEVVSAPAERSSRPAATFAGGALRVVYESYGVAEDTTTRMIVLASRTEVGFTHEVVATTDFPSPSWPRVHDAGDRLWVEWIDAAGQMAWRRGRAGGGFEPVALEPFEGKEGPALARGRIRQHATDGTLP